MSEGESVRTTTIQLLAATCLAAPLVVSAAQSDVGWQDLHFSVVDLDATDGVSAALTATFRDSCNGLMGNSWECNTGPVDSSFRIPSSRSTSIGMAPFDLGYPQAHMFLYDRLSFDLAPHTRLTVTGTLFSQSSGPDEGIWGDPNDYHIRGYSGTWATALVRTGDGDEVMVSTSYANPTRHEASFSLSITSGSETLSTWFLMDLLASGYSYQVLVPPPPPPIPEPSTYALLLAGMGAMGILHRRKRQGSRTRAG
jgi:hypothetical protein